MAVYIGRSGKKAITALYIGKSNSVKKVIAGYHSTGKKKFYQYITPPGQQVFTTSGTFKVPTGITSIDMFLVGGGGCGGGEYRPSTKCYGSSGGGGGYTYTVKGISVTPGQSCSVVIGAGETYTDARNCGQGGTTKFVVGSRTNTANGGYTGVSTGWHSISSNQESGKASWGGSGGGEGGVDYNNLRYYGGYGGSNGSSGYDACVSSGYSYANGTYGYASGQGTTTRAFGESTGTLYAGGGGGGGYKGAGYGGSGGGGKGAEGEGSAKTAATSGTAGTGGGGGGGLADGYYSVDGAHGVGGSGIAIIRWGY